MPTEPQPDSAIARWAIVLLFGPAAAWLVVVGIGLATTAARTAPPPDRTKARVTGSQTCARCHPDQHRTWTASYHRTMTQQATPQALLAPFAGETVAVLGFVATMTGGNAGTPHMRVVGETTGEVILDVDVELTVGSHHYQQYVARIDKGGGPLERYRLPLAWHIGQARWIHLAGAFLTPDGEAGNADDYLRHLSRWSDSCIMCHNTEPAPGKGVDGTFEPTIGELGIACESCHGRASQHVARYENPLLRLLTARDDRAADDTITHPDRLTAGRHADVCGRCHGQRIAADIASVLAHGDGFVPGQALRTVSRPIVADAQVNGLGPRPFADRFWPDTTPRLSAYEYQGLLASACHESGRGLTCGDCHTMHGEQPDGQLRADYSTTRVCGQCHPKASLSAAASPSGHGGHGDRLDCGACHMPEVTYGLLQGMSSHRITTPDPGAWVGRHDQPDACTQCHVDRSRRWAADAMPSSDTRSVVAPDPIEARAPRVVLDLLGGDPVQRILAAHALAQPHAVGEIGMRLQWLSIALADEYPAVRWVAWLGLTALATTHDRPVVAAALRQYEFMAPLTVRVAIESRVRSLLDAPKPLDDDSLAALIDARGDHAIWIGE